jgi:hypothetical protein
MSEQSSNFWKNKSRSILINYTTGKDFTISAKASLNQAIDIHSLMRIIGESECVEFVHENSFSKSCIVHFYEDNGYMIIFEDGSIFLEGFPSLQRCEKVAEDVCELLAVLKRDRCSTN